MKIYAQEKLDGLQDLIEGSHTIAYCAPISTSNVALEITDEDRAIALSNMGTQAENEKQFDLYYLSSVLVSSGWNKNDDVFDPHEMWEARSTPEDKQFNFMHDEKDIIGHITENYVVDFDGNALNNAANWDEAGSPKEFNIVTKAVLYRSWGDSELRERMNNIIKEIEEGNRWFVSMECMFPNFDYALRDAQGGTKIVRREEASAFLSKHLRAYGGNGKYEDYEVGRLLRNISFSGKGLVSKPANPRSVILNDNQSFSEFESELVTVSSIKETNMSDVLQKQLDDLKAELAEARLANETMKQEMEAQKTEAIESQLQTFQETISAKDEAMASVEAQVEETLTRVKELEEVLAASEAAKEEAIAKVAAIEKAAALEKRVVALTEAGLEGEELDEAIAKFEDLDQETFDFLVSQLAKAAKPPWLDKDKKKKDDEDEDKKDEKASKADDELLEEEIDESEASEEDLDEVEVEDDIAMAEGVDEEDPAVELRSSASDWFGGLLKTTANLK
tara:strand:+ start:1981 stop:3498 length:1518 start_codon:yes stop_codon:yes gene_type:complete